MSGTSNLGIIDGNERRNFKGKKLRATDLITNGRLVMDGVDVIAPSTTTGSIDVTKSVTTVDTTSAGGNLTLTCGAGTEGQLKIILYRVKASTYQVLIKFGSSTNNGDGMLWGGDSPLYTGVTAYSYKSGGDIIMEDAGDNVMLLFVGGKWWPLNTLTSSIPQT